ncbi:MAG TPA: tRNA (adenosine(37)-N6)-threonylcarbamoyltransferase complex ATPase subunit type 1 TsaE [Candidatus Paceibacterota bacterium]|nr:tRNA (adenosine(37)-N6)-threonylcarbamoyltransferase complex ATPase subunit type 1 TsaE [Candidatus Paceibacterota bacterium]
MISRSLEETAKIAADLAKSLEPAAGGGATVVALSGDLGAGKTTFAKAFAAALGLRPEDVTSPTFVIEKRFDIGDHAHFRRFIHIDAYRLEKAGEVMRLGWAETVADPANLVLIEWPENIGDALPADAVRVNFAYVSEEAREIVVQ